MGFLSQVFPGLRDFRTPFASGLLWLLFGWLLIEPHVNATHPHGVYDSIRTLNHAVQPLGLGFGIGLLAYLAGAITEVLWAPILRRLGLVSSSGLLAINAVVSRRLAELSDEEATVFGLCHSFSVRAFVTERAGRGPDRAPDDADVRALAQTPALVAQVARLLHTDLVSAVRDELDVAATRLLGKKQGQFEIYDRLRSEAEFRVALAGPVGAITYLVLNSAISSDLAALSAAVLALLLILQARNRRRSAGDRMADFLLVGNVAAPTLDQLKSGRFTFAALASGEVRTPRYGVPTRGSSYSPDGGVVIGMPFRVRLRGEATEAFVMAGELAADLASSAWHRIRSAAERVRIVGAGLTFVLRDVAANRGRVVRVWMSLWPDIRAHDSSALLRLGDAYRDSRYFSRAARTYGQLREMEATERLVDLDKEIAFRTAIDKGSAHLLPSLVDLYAEQDRLESARRACEAAVSRGVSAANLPLGDVLRALGDPAAAEKAYSAAIDASHSAGFVRLGELYARQGRKDEAVALLQKGVDMNAPKAQEALAALRTGTLRGGQGHSSAINADA